MIVPLAAALALDAAFGEPPNRWHPVAWMGGALAWGRARLAFGRPLTLLIAGSALVLAVAVAAGLLGWALTRAAETLGWAGAALEAVALKSAFSLRGLADAARAVHADLAAGDIEAARARLAHHLVSRPTVSLDDGQVASAAVESVAENLTDAFVAPLLFYAVLGLPGALFYRAVNTADAMLGYREGLLEHFGKCAARLDDLLNLIPARLAALAIVVASPAAGASAAGALRVLRADRGRTASPNAGWTMAAMAGALGVALEKPGVYRLGHGGLPAAADVPRSVIVLRAAAGVVVALVVAVFFVANVR